MNFMNVYQLRDNNDLFNYLVRLGSELESLKMQTLADRVLFASKFVTGSPSEFLHEAQEALKNVKTNCGSNLPEGRLLEVSNVIEQIEKAFQQVGGG